eukprot:s4367_g7.t1
MRCGPSSDESNLIRANGHVSKLCSDAIVKNVDENDLILQVHDEAPEMSTQILRNEVQHRDRSEVRVSRTFCCCGEATERLSAALSKDPHLWQAELEDNRCFTEQPQSSTNMPFNTLKTERRRKTTREVAGTFVQETTGAAQGRQKSTREVAGAVAGEPTGAAQGRQKSTKEVAGAIAGEPTGAAQGRQKSTKEVAGAIAGDAAGAAQGRQKSTKEVAGAIAGETTAAVETVETASTEAAEPQISDVNVLEAHLDDEADRAVQIHAEFDEYDPLRKRTAVRSHHGDVLRSRRKRHFKQIMHEGAHELASLASSASSTSLCSEHEKEDAITNWAVLVGKALWCYMKGAGQVGQRQKLGLISAAFNIGFGRCSGSTSVTCSMEVKASANRSRGKGALRRATAVVSQLKELVSRVGKEEDDVLDEEWDVDALSFLFSADYMDSLMILAGGASWALRDDETVVQISQPCRIFGDIHGQLRDLLIFFHAFGLPTKTGPSFVFNGDFVDRGAHQLEVIGLLFALKIAFPKRIFLVRGNHEDALMNRKYGFFESCTEQLGSFAEKAFNNVQKAFEWLPLACLIDGKILTVHGGIGDGKWTIDELACVKRPLNSEVFLETNNRWLYNILWSDPIPDDGAGKDLFGVHTSPRTASAVNFGWNITKTFCAMNGIDVIVRSHQCVDEGRGFEVMHDQHLVRVFSARDYEGHRNDASMISICRDRSSLNRVKLVLRMHGLRSLVRLENEVSQASFGPNDEA